MSRSSRRSPPISAADGGRDEPAPRSRRLNLALLWQGQLVSSLGDALYRIALGFWILAETGSTAIAGGVIAASTLPRVLLSPLAGAAADRLPRKWILVAADLSCGAAVLWIGVAARGESLELWMVVAASLAVGAGAAFFNPTLEAVLPDLVARGNVVRANAAFALAGTGAALIGSSIGGFAYAAAGASLLFALNGLSFVFSALTELPLKLPPPPRSSRPPGGLRGQLRAGAAAVRAVAGLGWLFSASIFASFLMAGLFFLLMALCQRRADLGSAAYGLLMGGLSAGAIAGYLLTSAGSAPPRARAAVFFAGGVASGAALAVVPAIPGTAGMVPLLAIAGLGISLSAPLFTTAVQLSVPDADRGTVLGLRFALMTGATPLGVAAAGLASEVVDPAHLIAFAGSGIAAAYLATSRVRSARAVLGVEPGRR